MKLFGQGSRKFSPWHAAACLTILLAAATLRIIAAQGDLWLDEIWSLETASHIASPLDVFTTVHNDNNHYLNTLFLYMVGTFGPWCGYRDFSILTGLGAVAAAGWIGCRRNVRAGLPAMWLVGFSYVMILYSSEARGYGAAVFFALLAFESLDRYFQTGRRRLAVLFALGAAAGLLSHLTFVSFYLATLVWSGYWWLKWRKWLRANRRLLRATADVFLCHAVPAALLATLYFVDIRHIVFNGGTCSNPLEAYETAVAWTLAAPAAGYAVLLACLAAAVVLVAGLRLLSRERPDLAVFFAGAIVVFPLLLTFASETGVFYVRYFIIAVAFFLVLLSCVLADIYRRGAGGKTICILLLLAFLAANGRHLADLFENGRGRYSEAVRFMAENSTQSPTTVGTGDVYPAESVLRYHGLIALGDRMPQYVSKNAWPPHGPEWILCQKESFEPPLPEVEELRDSAGNRYEFVKTFPAAPLSGLHWFLYHNSSLAGAGAKPAAQ